MVRQELKIVEVLITCTAFSTGLVSGLIKLCIMKSKWLDWFLDDRFEQETHIAWQLPHGTSIHCLLYMLTENMFQHTTGTSGLRGCKERGQEEHDRWSQG